MGQIKIENIVSSITLEVKVDLKKFIGRVTGIEYNPKNFPGAVYRIHKPKLAMLIFSSGKVICTGAKSMEDVDAAIVELEKKLSEGGIKIKTKPKVEVQNIVASSSIGTKVNLDQLAIECLNAEYEPEQFPGLVLRLDEPKSVMLVFRSGKIVITGVKMVKDIKKAAEETEKLIIEYAATIS